MLSSRIPDGGQRASKTARARGVSGPAPPGAGLRRAVRWGLLAVSCALLPAGCAVGATAHPSSHAPGRTTATGRAQSTTAARHRAARHGRISNSPSPANVVEDYIEAINDHDYERAWQLGGVHFGHPYRAFVAGFADTMHDVVTLSTVHGATVGVELDATGTDGVVTRYTGSFTVSQGSITRAHLVPIGARRSGVDVDTGPLAGTG